MNLLSVSPSIPLCSVPISEGTPWFEIDFLMGWGRQSLSSTWTHILILVIFILLHDAKVKSGLLQNALHNALGLSLRRRCCQECSVWPNSWGTVAGIVWLADQSPIAQYSLSPVPSPIPLSENQALQMSLVYLNICIHVFSRAKILPYLRSAQQHLL